MRIVVALLAIAAIPAVRLTWQRLARWRFSDPIIDRLIRPPADRGYGKHDEAQETSARQRRERSLQLAKDAAQARLPRRLVVLEESARFVSRRP